METRNTVIGLAAVAFAGAVYAAEPQRTAPQAAERQDAAVAGASARTNDAPVTVVIDAEEALGRANNMPDNRLPAPPGLGSALEASMPASVQVSAREAPRQLQSAPNTAR